MLLCSLFQVNFVQKGPWEDAFDSSSVKSPILIVRIFNKSSTHIFSLRISRLVHETAGSMSKLPIFERISLFAMNRM
jgi:hypothetical protein